MSHPYRDRRVRGTWIVALVACFALACSDDEPSPVAPESVAPSASLAPSAVRIDAALTSLLSGIAPVEAIVTFDPAKTSSSRMAESVRRLGLGVVTFRHLPMVAVRGTPVQVRSVTSVRGVRGLWANRTLEYHLNESIESIQAQLVWSKLGYRGRGIGVAILDSGIDGVFATDVAYPTRTTANVKIVANAADVYTTDGEPYVGGDLYVDNLPNTDTSVGHGTHVAAIAAGDGTNSTGGIYTGVAPEATLVGISTGDALLVLWALAGFDYVLENRVRFNLKVVNNSWGSSGLFDPEDPINLATRIVTNAGVTVVFSAGNCGSGGDVDCPAASENKVNPYSAAPWVISVAAGCKTVSPDPTNSASGCVDGRNGLLADFSSRGLPGDPIHHPDITAPGVRIVSARAATGTAMNALDLSADARLCNIAPEHLAYYTCAGGTSMAAPHVSGVVALMQQAARGRLSPARVIEILKATATPMPGYAGWEVGNGYLNAYQAVRQAKKG